MKRACSRNPRAADRRKLRRRGKRLHGISRQVSEVRNAADAQYYLGESLLYQGQLSRTRPAHTGKLIKDYPTSSNAPTGLVELGARDAV